MKLVVGQYNTVEINFECLIQRFCGLNAKFRIDFSFSISLFSESIAISECTCCLVVMQRGCSCAACNGIAVVNVVMHWR